MRVGNIAGGTLAAVLLAGTASAQNLLTNGGFEGSATGWTLSGGASQNANATFLRSGTGALLFNLSSSSGSAAQVINLAAGTYTVQFHYAVGATEDFNGVNLTLVTTFGGNNVANIAETINTTGYGLAAPYQAVTQNVTVGAGAQTLSFTGTTTKTSQVSYFIDDVSVVLVSLASTAVTGTLTGSGAASTRVATESGRGFMETVFGRMGLGGGETSTTLGFTRNPITVVALQPEAAGALGLTRSEGGLAADGVGVPHFWIAGFGGGSRLDEGGTLTSQRGGAVFGADVRLSPRLLVGVSGGYGQSRFGLEAERNGGRSTEAQIGLYGTWQPALGGTLDRLYLNALAAYGQTRIQTYRSAAGASGQQEATFTIPSVLASLEAGLPFATDIGTVTPFARATGTVLWRPGYTESQSGGNSGLNAVTVERDTIGSGQTVLGAKLAEDVTIGGQAVRLSGELGWGHQFNRKPAVTFRTVGAAASQSATGVAPPADTAQVGLGARLFLDNGPEVFTTYSGQYGSAYRDHILFVGARFAW